MHESTRHEPNRQTPLSELQLSVLRFALANHSRRKADGASDLYTYEILVRRANFLPKWNRRIYVGQRPPGYMFSRTDNPEPDYTNARTTVARSIRRLEQRGFVERWEGNGQRWSGLRITAAGAAIVWASGLLELRRRISSGLPNGARHQGTRMRVA
jgi:hypothetical protein